MRHHQTVGSKTASLFCASLLALVAGCASSPKSDPGPVASNAPEWVNKGSGAFKDAGGSGMFYGVGIAQGIKNRALQVEAADSRARQEIAKTMNVYVASLMKSYQASTTAGDMEKSSEEQHVQSTLKEFAKFTLHGVTIVDHWKDPADGTMFALAKLDMNAVKKTLEDAKELDSKVRDYVRTNAEKAFDEVSAEETKH